MQHVKHSVIVCLWNPAWRTKAHLGSQLPIMILCYVLKLDDPPLYKWGSKLVLVVRRKRVELLIELLGGDYGTHSGIIAPLLGTLFLKHSVIVCLWNQAWQTKAHLGSQLPIVILCYVLKLDDPPLYKWGSKLVLVVHRKRVELLIELLRGDYGIHSGIIALSLAHFFHSKISRVLRHSFS